MQLKLINGFLYSASALLLATAVIKIASASGHARILQEVDPILGVSFRFAFYVIGGVELVIAIVGFFSAWTALRTGLVAWLATSFLVYRLGLLWVGYHRPCRCLGNLTDTLHIPAQVADIGMQILVGYLLIGSYSTLLWLWNKGRKSPISITEGPALPC